MKKIQEINLFLEIDGPFGFAKSFVGNKNLYNACFSFFMTIFNNDECPLGKNICTKSNYIKVMFDGGTYNSFQNSKCGTEAIRDVFITNQFFSNYIDYSKIYGEINELLINLGYSYGFSFGGIPNDFRKFVATNTFATNVFRYMVESFYNNTGKQVIIIAHSFGNLVTLHNLVSKENEDLIPKIKKFVSIGPTFGGSTKLLNGYLHGLKDFDHALDIIYFDPFGQSLLFKSVPTVTELRPQPIFAKLLKIPKYNDFVDAIVERITLEKMISKKNYDDSTIKIMSEKFDKLFISYFPSLTDYICKNNNDITTNPIQRKCFANIFNVFDCPMVVTLDNLDNTGDIENYCNKNDENLYYINEIGEERKSIEELLTKGRYTFGMPEMKEFFKEYNKNLKQYKLDKNLNYSDFETEEEFRKENLLQIEHFKNISLIQDLPIPPVDTDIIYTSAIDTMTGEFLKKDDILKNGKKIISGGDGTVSTWSTLLVGLKWIYDKKMDDLPQNIRLVEYCSKLIQNKHYGESSKFVPLDCKCLKDDGKTYTDFDDCDHQKMLLDPSLLSYIYRVIFNNKNNISLDRINAAKEALVTKNYENICNLQLLKFTNCTDQPVDIPYTLFKVLEIIGIVCASIFIPYILLFFFTCCCKENEFCKKLHSCCCCSCCCSVESCWNFITFQCKCCNCKQYFKCCLICRCCECFQCCECCKCKKCCKCCECCEFCNYCNCCEFCQCCECWKCYDCCECCKCCECCECCHCCKCCECCKCKCWEYKIIKCIKTIFECCYQYFCPQVVPDQEVKEVKVENEKPKSEKPQK